MGAIYQMNCKCGAVHNGETKVGLKNRIKQHETKIKENDINSSSEIVKHHYIKKGLCYFDPKKAFIIDNETNYWKRRKKEAIYSIMNKSINKYDLINDGWNKILYKESKKIKQLIENKQKK